MKMPNGINKKTAEEFRNSGVTDVTKFIKRSDYVTEDIIKILDPTFDAKDINARVLAQPQTVHGSRKYINPKNGTEEEVYPTFMYIFGDWIYRGFCFKGENTDVSLYKDYNTISDYMKETEEDKNSSFYKLPRPRVVCKDGFSMSVQKASSALDTFFNPANTEDDNYTSLEIGFPSKRDDIIILYAEKEDKPTETVYPGVPSDVIDELIASHGGYFIA